MCILQNWKLIKNWKLKKSYKKSYNMYLESKQKSKAAIENVSFSDGMAPLYFSDRRFNNFLDTFSISPVISSIVEDSKSNGNSITGEVKVDVKKIVRAGAGMEINHSDSENNKITKSHREDSYITTIKNNIERIKSKGCSILDATENNFFYANLPVFHGRLTDLTNQVKDVYLWYGEYRNIKLYLCGNANNVFSEDKDEHPNTEWDPSTITGQKDIFQHLINEENTGNYNNKEVFELFEYNIHQSVMNRTKSISSYRWQEMLVYCTNIKEENGIKKIIGIPLLIIPSKGFGYGWYNLKYKRLNEGKIKNDNTINNKDAFFELDQGKFKINEDINNKDAFFEFDNGNFTGKVLLIERDTLQNLSPDNIIFSDRIDTIDANNAYKNRYTIEKVQQIPSSKMVKNCCDIIGICIDKNLLK